MARKSGTRKKFVNISKLVDSPSRTWHTRISKMKGIQASIINYNMNVQPRMTWFKISN